MDGTFELASKEQGFEKLTAIAKEIIRALDEKEARLKSLCSLRNGAEPKKTVPQNVKSGAMLDCPSLLMEGVVAIYVPLPETLDNVCVLLGAEARDRPVSRRTGHRHQAWQGHMDGPE